MLKKIKKLIHFIIRWGTTLFFIGFVTKSACKTGGYNYGIKVFLILMMIFVVPYIFAVSLRWYTNHRVRAEKSV